MNQNEDNNYHDQNYGQGPYPPIQPQQPMPPAGGPDRKGGGNFLLGLMAGILITAMVGSCAYIGVRVYLLATGKAARITAGSDSTSDNLVSEETIKKLEALEEDRKSVV